MDHLERAIQIAIEAHAGQTDKGGSQYILHPLRLMLKMDTDEERIVAVLHDVVEDSDWTFSRLAEEGFSSVVIEALENLTHRRGEDYDSYIQRAASSGISAKVKLADLEDNCNVSRLQSLTPQDHQRLAKYTRATAILRALIDAGKTDMPIS